MGLLNAPVLATGIAWAGIGIGILLAVVVGVALLFMIMGAMAE